MSRRANFARALATGYGTTIVNIFYTLASVPLALAYLPTREFGLWALVAQVASYLALIDCGMSGSISRLLVDQKDDKSTGAYGNVLKTSFAVTISQGVIAASVGVMVAPWVADLSDIPSDLRQSFLTLVALQCVFFGFSLALKICSHLLNAHQRYDVINHAQSVAFAVMFGAQWLAFHAGQGVFSLLWSSAAGVLVITTWTLASCLRLNLVPPAGARGTFSWTTFRQIFGFGAELSMQVLGGQLLNASQLIIVTRFLGLEAAAIYAVCVKTFNLAQQAVWRVFDFSIAALSEMVVRGERERLMRRFRDIVILGGSLSVVVGITVAACNTPFVTLWTHGKVHWPALNNWLLAGTFIAFSFNRVHGGLAWIAKDVRKMRYVYFVEGLLFVGTAVCVVPIFGMAGIIGASIITDCLVSGCYGASLSARFLRMRWRTAIAAWFLPPARLLTLFGPIAFGIWMLTQPLAPVPQLAVNAIVIGTIGMSLLWITGLDAEHRAEIRAMLQNVLPGVGIGRRKSAISSPVEEER